MGATRVTMQNLEVARVDSNEGLVLIKGGVPGSKGSWVEIRDAVKTPTPEGVITPAATDADRKAARKAADEAKAAAAAEAEAEAARIAEERAAAMAATTEGGTDGTDEQVEGGDE